MSSLRDLKGWEEIYFIVDLLASEYGWTIDYIQKLTVSEIYGLIYSILRRKGVKFDLPPKKSQDPMSNLLNLARQLKASPDQLKSLQEGKGIKL